MDELTVSNPSSNFTTSTDKRETWVLVSEDRSYPCPSVKFVVKKSSFFRVRLRDSRFNLFLTPMAISGRTTEGQPYRVNPGGRDAHPP